jgi:hypothetical protein
LTKEIYHIGLLQWLVGKEKEEVSKIEYEQYVVPERKTDVHAHVGSQKNHCQMNQ